MCYNNCRFESYNPVTGNCACRRGSNPCPEELEDITCVYCGFEFEPDGGDNEECPDCGEVFVIGEEVEDVPGKHQAGHYSIG